MKRLLTTVSLSLAACVTAPPSGTFGCGANGACPDGQVCNADSVCVEATDGAAAGTSTGGNVASSSNGGASSAGGASSGGASTAGGGSSGGATTTGGGGSTTGGSSGGGSTGAIPVPACPAATASNACPSDCPAACPCNPQNALGGCCVPPASSGCVVDADCCTARGAGAPSGVCANGTCACIPTGQHCGGSPGCCSKSCGSGICG